MRRLPAWVRSVSATPEEMGCCDGRLVWWSWAGNARRGQDAGSGSDLSYKVEFGAGYKINEDWLVGLGFRYLDIDYEDGDTTDSDYYAYDGNEYGLLLGILYKI